MSDQERPVGATGSGRGVAYLVAGAFFMEMLDSTVITTALPQMAQSFGVRPADMSIGMSAYLLALAVFIPVSGWVADRYGSRRVFGGALALFTLASVLCGVSQSLGQFTAARILQGLGGAMMVPVGRLAVLRATPRKDMITAIAIITWPGLAAPVIGPPVGGFITAYWSWHWIFFLNVPLGLLALALTFKFVRDGAGVTRRPFDGLGFVLIGAGCSLLMYAMDLASDAAVRLPRVGLLALLAVVVIAVAWRHLRRAAHPMVDLSPFDYPTFRVMAVGGSLFRIAIASAPFLLPLMFQVGLGMDPVQSGTLMLALFAGNLSMKAATTWIMRRWGVRRVLVVNGILVAIGFGMCGLFEATTPLWFMVPVLFVAGLCRSMQYTVLNTMAFADVSQASMSGATTLFSMLQQLNSGIGIAFGAIALRAAEWVYGTEGLPGPSEFHWALWASSALALLAIVDGARLSADAGSAMSGHKRSA
jgi:EmrB/QacA subfamily drug resistance transporter